MFASSVDPPVLNRIALCAAKSIPSSQITISRKVSATHLHMLRTNMPLSPLQIEVQSVSRMAATAPCCAVLMKLRITATTIVHWAAMLTNECDCNAYQSAALSCTDDDRIVTDEVIVVLCA